MPRSAREIDLDSRTYVGLSFPLRADNNNSFAMTKNSIQQSKHNLRNLLLTYPGERVHNPEFGCKLREACFEQQDENLPEKIQTTIADAVTKFFFNLTQSLATVICKLAGNIDITISEFPISISLSLLSVTLKKIAFPFS